MWGKREKESERTNEKEGLRAREMKKRIRGSTYRPNEIAEKRV